MAEARPRRGFYRLSLNYCVGLSAVCPSPRQSAIFIGAGQPAEADDISRQDRREFPGLGHDCPSASSQTSTITRSEPARLNRTPGTGDVSLWPILLKKSEY